MLRCQADSFFKEFTTKLVAVVEGEFVVTLDSGTRTTVKGAGLILEDTILFPEGGGQPCDHGELTIVNEESAETIHLQVTHVLRKDGKVVHLVENSEDHILTDLPAGATVHQKLDWNRRNYHMIQHSGQHLLSALAEKLFGFQTLSWCLGQDCSFVELGVDTITDEQFKVLETECNKYIYQASPLYVHFYQPGDPELKKAKTRGLPENHTGGIRVIEIQGFDYNMCCGTHVSNLGQLRVMKLLKTERKTSKKEVNSLLYFIVGEERIFKAFEEMQRRENLICQGFNTTPKDLVNTVLKTKESLKKALKKIKTLQEENVMAQINTFKASISQKNASASIFSLHRPDGDIDLMNFTIRQFKDLKNVTLFLTVGEKEEGMMILVGTEELVADVGPEICSILDGKGKATGSRFMARVSHLSARNKAEELLRSMIDSLAPSA